MSEALIKTSNLCRYYRKGQFQICAVNHVNIEIKSGELVALVGASGSGKTTLLNLLAGLDSPTSGIIEVAGTQLNKLKRKDLASYRAKRIGVIFQSFNLLSHHTAIRNVEIALYFNHTPRSERRRRALKILDNLGLAERISHNPADLSGGEQQRVSIARALVKEPEILLADEPTGNLDQENSQAIAKLLAELNRKGLTIVMVTHDKEVAQMIASRIIKMHYGKIVEELFP